MSEIKNEKFQRITENDQSDQIHENNSKKTKIQEKIKLKFEEIRIDLKNSDEIAEDIEMIQLKTEQEWDLFHQMLQRNEIEFDDDSDPKIASMDVFGGMDGDTLATSCSTLDLGNGLILINRLVTHELYRNKNIASRLLDFVVTKLKDNIFVTRIPIELDLKFIFAQFDSEFFIERYLICRQKSLLTRMASGEIFRKNFINSQEIVIENFHEFSTEINNYDSSICPILRNCKWHFETINNCLLARNVNGKICGIIGMKKIKTGWSLQPFYADNLEIADKLLVAALCSNWKIETSDMIISIPANNAEGLELIENYFYILEEKEYKWRMRNSDENISLKSNLIFSLLDINTTIS